MVDIVRGVNTSDMITEITHIDELLDNGKIEDARLAVKNLCMGVAEYPSQLDGVEVTKEVVRAYLRGVESLLDIREAA